MDVLEGLLCLITFEISSFTLRASSPSIAFLSSFWIRTGVDDRQRTGWAGVRSIERRQRLPREWALFYAAYTYYKKDLYSPLTSFLSTLYIILFTITANTLLQWHLSTQPFRCQQTRFHNFRNRSGSDCSANIDREQEWQCWRKEPQRR